MEKLKASIQKKVSRRESMKTENCFMGVEKPARRPKPKESNFLGIDRGDVKKTIGF
jgi:hypothetical protein